MSAQLQLFQSLFLYSFELSFFLFISYLCYGAIYNRFFHPLRRIPGPFLGSITGLYKLYVLKALPPRGLALHNKYGSVVRIAPDLLLVNEPRMMPLLYNRKAHKTPFYSSWMFGGVQPMFQVKDSEEHARKKTIVSECTSMKTMLRFEHRLDERITELCDVLDRRFAATGDRLDFAEYIRYFLSDTYAHMAYGKPVGCVNAGQDAAGQIGALQSVYGLAVASAILPDVVMPLVRNSFVQKHLLPRTSAFRGLKCMTDMYDADVSRRSSPERKSQEGFLDGIWRPTQHSGRVPLSDVEVKAEYITFTSAALDGVAAFICPFTDNLINRPDMQERILAELASAESRGVISRPVAQHAEITAHLPYFSACIAETLRHDSPVETMLPRHAPATGIWFEDLYIPPGTQMGASPWLMHRDRAVFGDDAAEFRPERWLEDPARVALMERFSMTFGAGSRDCAGQNYARMQISKTCLELVRRFQLAHANVGDEPTLVHTWGAVGLYSKQWMALQSRALEGSSPPVEVVVAADECDDGLR